MKNLNLLFVFMICLISTNTYSQGEDIDGEIVMYKVTKGFFNYFLSHPRDFGEFIPNPNNVKIENDKKNGKIKIMGVVYLGLYPMENIEIYVCKKRKHFGRNTELWDSKYKIKKKIGYNNMKYYTIEGENYYYNLNLKENKVEAWKEIEQLEKNYSVWTDTTGIFSISIKYDEYPVFWSPKLKKGTLLFIR